jgi:NAD(P)-dependent dehydrogenase (short-subunit alcohol dehydrogenase family)
MQLTGKIALVSGAGRGIGAAIARKLTAEGATVVCTDVDLSAAHDSSQACGPHARAAYLDVTHPEHCDALVQELSHDYGTLDILVNNAGITRDAMLHKMTDEQWHEVLQVDLSGTFYLLRAASRVMRQQRSGAIVNIASASWLGNVGQANYSAAKAGVVGLTRTAAKELARYQVRVNAICPGFIDTAMTRAIPELIRQQQLTRIPLGRPGRPEDVANATAFLASDESAYITGEILSVGGGYVPPP